MPPRLVEEASGRKGATICDAKTCSRVLSGDAAPLSPSGGGDGRMLRRCTSITADIRRRPQHRWHRGWPASPQRSSTSPALWTSALLALLSFATATPQQQQQQQQRQKWHSYSYPQQERQWPRPRQLQQQRRQQQDASATIPPCPIPLASGGVYTVSLPRDAADLATDLASCTGGAYNVTWTGAVELTGPLVVAADSTLTITGARGSGGGSEGPQTAAVLDGGGLTGLVDLGAGSSLRLEDVTLRNGRRESGNGGAVRAEGAGCSVVAFSSRFEDNAAALSSNWGGGGGMGGALSLGSGVTAELENCVLSGNHAEDSGGAVWSQGGGGYLRLTGCVLENNTAGWWGGAVGLQGRSTVVLDGSTFSKNFAVEEGGGVYGVNATVEVSGKSEFVDNTVGQAGAGISLHEGSDLNISETIFRRNWLVLTNTSNAHGSGGGVRVIGGSSRMARVSIADTLFDDNFATHGAGLWISSGYVLSAVRTIFRDNEANSLMVAAAFGGGASLGSDGVAELSACNFTGNYAFNGGGGLMAEDCSVFISDSLFEGNNNRFEGGALVAEENAIVTLQRSAFVDNYISGGGVGSGGAIVVSRATLRATDSVFDSNRAIQEDSEYDINADPLEGGGAVKLADMANATFSGCNFTLNHAAVGGAVLVDGASTATLTGAVVTSNQAVAYGGGLSFHERSFCFMNDSFMGENTAAAGGGGLHLSGATGALDGVTFDGNSVSAGSGGAVHVSSASNMTVTGGGFASNSASRSGGHVLATNAGTNVELISSSSSSSSSPAPAPAERGLQAGELPTSPLPSPLVLAYGHAGVHGGAVHASDGAAVTAFSVELSRNRAERNGGAVSALGARLVRLDDCNTTANICGGGGGGASVEDGAFVGAGSNFTLNSAVADGGGLRVFSGARVELEDCQFNGNSAQVGGGVSSVDATLLATRCQVTGNSASSDGGGLRVAYQTSAVLDSCDISFNAASFDGGGVAVDASSGTTGDNLNASNASSTLTCRGGGTFEGNQAGERGGAVYVTRESTVTFDACSSLRNFASLGAAVYASHSIVLLEAGSVLAYDQVPTGAVVYALKTRLEANDASFLAEDSASMLAVQMTHGSSMKALACSFRGWGGSGVVLAGGELEMDMCDFTESPAEVLVTATNATTPARIRNAAVGVKRFANLDPTAVGANGTTLSRNVMTCASDPCGSGTAGATKAGAADARCIDGSLGVFCPCFVTTVTEEEKCLGEKTTLQLESTSDQLVALGTQGIIESELTITAGREGGPVVWTVEEVDFSNRREPQRVAWTIVPDVGILEAGGTVTVAISGKLNSDIDGKTSSKFKAQSLQSGEFALCTVNTTFYYCEKGEYYDENEECLQCSSLDNQGAGLDCDAPGVLRTTLPLASGYWRSSNTTTTIRQCLNEAACKGGAVIQQSDDYCAGGYTGPYCAVCALGFAGGISKGCHRCSEGFRAAMYLLAAIAGVLLVAFLWLLVRYLVQAPSGTRTFFSCMNGRMVTRARQLPLHKLKIPIVVFQVLTQYTDITTVEFPSGFTKFLTFWDAVNLDVGWLLSASCIFKPTFYGRLLLTTLVPLVLGLALACTFVFAKSRVMSAALPKDNERSMRSVASGVASHGMSESRQLSVVKRRHMAVLITGTFLIYSTVSTVVFQTFACDTLDEVGKSYLRADYSLRCHTSQHTVYKIYASVMILVYPVGIPMLYAWQLFSHRHRIYPKQALRDGVSPERRLMDKKIAHTVLLWQAYRPSRYYYEVIECFRRLLLTGCLVFILPDSAGQAGVACVLAMATVCLFIALRPFSDPNDERLYILGCILIFLSMFVSLVPKVEIADGDEQSQTVVSWLLIVLSVLLWGMAIAQCCWEVQSATRDASVRSDAGDSSAMANLIGSDGFSRRSSGGGGVGGEEKWDGLSSGYKNSSPVDPHTGNPSSSELYDISRGNSGGGSSAAGGGGSGVRGRLAFGSGGGGGGHGGKADPYHLSGGSSAAGSTARGASGYADPVVLPFGDGTGGDRALREGGGRGGNGATGWEQAAAAAPSYSGNQSQISANTYGPIRGKSSRHGGSGSGSGGDFGSSFVRFPPTHYPHDSADESATRAEEMFSKRLGNGTGGNGKSIDRCPSHGKGGGSGGGARVENAAVYSSSESPTMADPMFPRRLGGGSGGSGRSRRRDPPCCPGEGGGESGQGGGAGGEWGRSAAIFSSSDSPTRAEDMFSKRLGGGSGGGGRGRSRGSRTSAGEGEGGGGQRIGAGNAAMYSDSDSSAFAEDMFSRRLGDGGEGGADGGSGPPYIAGEERDGGREGGGGGKASMYSSSDSPTRAFDMFARRLGGSGGGRSGGVSGSGQNNAPAVPSSALGRVSIFSGIDEHGGEEGSDGGRSTGSLRLGSAEPLSNDDAFPAPMTNAFPASTFTPESVNPGGGGRAAKKAGSGEPLSPSPTSSLALLGPSPVGGQDSAAGSARGSEWRRLGSGTIGGGGSNRSP